TGRRRAPVTFPPRPPRCGRRGSPGSFHSCSHRALYNASLLRALDSANAPAGFSRVLDVRDGAGESVAGVGRQRGGVIPLDVEIHRRHPNRGHVAERVFGEELSYPTPLRRRGNPKYVDLGRVRTGFTFHPHVSEQFPAVAASEPEHLRVEPRLGDPFLQIRVGEPALLGVVSERG